MDENLLGYLLNNLDDQERAQVESQLQSDPRARQRLELLRQAAAPLEADRGAFPPPPDMVMKTLARVAEHCCRELPRSPQAPRERLMPGRPFWRRADVLVAAALLLTALTLFPPWLAHLRFTRAQVECKNNLRDFYMALANYNDVHKELPNFAAKSPPRNVAGLVAPILHDAHSLPDSFSIRCPANGGPVPCNWTMAQIGAMTVNEFKEKAPRFIPCYAYSLGYHDEKGYHCPNMAIDPCISSSVPLMADRPPDDVESMVNSPNHGGYGQNVLYTDGHVVFLVQRAVSDDDIYLNRDHKVANGIGCRDAVLGSSGSQP